MANDWTEHYTELSHALLRVASLVYCGEHDYQRFYAHSAEKFPAAAAQLLATTTTDPTSAEEQTPPELITADQAAQWAGRPLSVDDLRAPGRLHPEFLDPRGDRHHRLQLGLTRRWGPVTPPRGVGRAPFFFRNAGRRGLDGHLAVAEIRSPSPFLAVSGAPSMTDGAPSRSTHTRTALRGPSDLFGPTAARPRRFAPAGPGRKPRCARRGLFGVDQPTPPVPAAHRTDRHQAGHRQQRRTP